MVNDFRLQVWELTELADDRLEWTLAHEADLGENDRTMSYLRNKLRMQPSMQWAVVETSEDMIGLFKDYSSGESSDECDDVTEMEEEEEEDDCEEDDETQGEEGDEQYNMMMTQKVKGRKNNF
jgi:hypothetical protein